MVAVKSPVVGLTMVGSVNVATVTGPVEAPSVAVTGALAVTSGPTVIVTVLVATADVVTASLTLQSMVWLAPIWLVVLKVIESSAALYCSDVALPVSVSTPLLKEVSVMLFCAVKFRESPGRKPLSIFTVAPVRRSLLSGSLTCSAPSSVAGVVPNTKVALPPAVTLGGVCTTSSVLVTAAELSRPSFTT